MNVVAESLTAPQRHLGVARRDARDSRIHPVGRLSRTIDGAAFEFRYLNNVKGLDRFAPLPGFPELESCWPEGYTPFSDARFLPLITD